MMEEYTDANIPEFTFGPDNFNIRELTIKPLSVNKMGFYKEWNDNSVPISPIKNTKASFSNKLCSFRAEKLEKSEVMSDADSDFYENQDILSLDTEEKWRVSKVSSTDGDQKKNVSVSKRTYLFLNDFEVDLRTKRV